jgi:hypothetical protein
MSKTNEDLFLVLVIALPFNISLSQKESGWRGIVPLHSTRADVERRFGTSTNDCQCVYKSDDATIHVEYAMDRCKGFIPGWNVPGDTVLSFTVRPTVQQHFSELKLKIEEYTVRRDDTFTTYYANRSEGIEYAVSSDGMINSVSYIPSSGDNGLRCSGFPGQDGSVTNHTRFDEYGDLDFNSETGRLDTFAMALDRTANLKGYIVVYAGKIACPNQARSRANRARTYLINKRGLNPTRIFAIDGGYRERFSVELYALPENAGPPNIVPTIARSEVKMVKSQRCN